MSSSVRVRLLDVLCVTTGLLGVWLALVPSRPVLPGEAAGWWWADLVGGVGAVVLLLARRRAPVVVAVVLGLLTTVLTTVWLAGAIAVFAVAVRRPWPVALGIGVLSLASTALQSFVRARTPEAMSWGTVGYGVAIMAGVIAWGAAIRGHHRLAESLGERAERAEREAALRAEAARTGERTRIAREMHDVLGHRLSLVSMHAAALAHRRQAGRTIDPAEIDEAVSVIRSGAQDALNDLRAILGVLRTEVDDAGRAPQPTLVDLDRLVDGVRAAGAEVGLHDDLAGGVAAVPDECGRALYRITQEALTNAARHAPGCPVVIRLRGRPGGDAELDVTNPLPVPVAAGSGGAGLVGIAERVELAGGEVLSCGPDGGAFRLTVRVPWPSGARRAAGAAP